MTREEATAFGNRVIDLGFRDETQAFCETAIKALEQEPICPSHGIDCEDCPAYEPCDDAISRQAVLDLAKKGALISNGNYKSVCKAINELPSVNPQPKTGHCKDCKYFEYDSVAKVCGIPLIVAHEICSRWGDGCKTKEDGYCFLYEPQERSSKE